MLNYQGLLTNQLTADELMLLDQQLITKGDLNVFEVHGFLCAIISGPRVIPTQSWLSFILGENPKLTSMSEVQEFISLVMRLNNQIADSLLQDIEFIPLVDCQPISLFSAEAFNVEQESHLQDWCEGYMCGIDLDVEAWMNPTNSNIALMLLPFVTLSRDSASLPEIGTIFEEKPTPAELEEHRKLMISLLPKHIIGVYDFWRNEKAPDQVSTSKINRNDPCPCGSGKKFKKCCYLRDALH